MLKQGDLHLQEQKLVHHLQVLQVLVVRHLLVRHLQSIRQWLLVVHLHLHPHLAHLQSIRQWQADLLLCLVPVHLQADRECLPCSQHQSHHLCLRWQLRCSPTWANLQWARHKGKLPWASRARLVARWIKVNLRHHHSLRASSAKVPSLG